MEIKMKLELLFDLFLGKYWDHKTHLGKDTHNNLFIHEKVWNPPIPHLLFSSYVNPVSPLVAPLSNNSNTRAVQFLPVIDNYGPGGR